MGVVRPALVFRFGPFQLNVRAGELRRNAVKVRVPDQSIQILAMLLEHAGEMVTREELHQKLWPNGTIVEFDHSINAAIKRLRQALEDSSEEPRFIETLPRRGYRFILPVGRVESAETAAPSEPGLETGELAGQEISHYRILKKLGQGAMGVVYQAEDTRLSRRVAIKFLCEELSDDPQALERFQHEARAASALNHPNICTVHEVSEHDDVPFIVMEYITGKSLDQLIGSDALPMNKVLNYAVQITDALISAHSAGIVHRDLKPANIMVNQDGLVKLLDFGLAKQFGKRPQTGDDATTATLAGLALTELGAAIGTPDYMSPEQVKGQALDQRSDLFSFGILLCELLGSVHPFRRASTTETLAAILRDSPNLSGDLPQGLMVLIRRLLAKSRDERYPSMAEVRADLARLVTSSEGVSASAADERIPLIGREQEFAELNRPLEEALAGRGSLVLIGGEPGIGKTHLAGALLEEAKRRGAFAVIGHCYEMEGAQPYVPFVEMLEYSARTAPRESLRYVLGDDAPEVAKLMPELRVMYPDMPSAIQLPPEQQRRFLFNAYRAFVERSARLTPIVAVVEDLHWADEPTLLLLQHVVQTISSTPMLLIGTYRDMELEVAKPFAKTLETLLRQKQATRISLRRLAVEEVESMLAAMSGQKPPPSLAHLVFEETEGNPFFVEEVYRHLSEEGKLFDEAGQWRPGLRVDQLRVPEGVQLVLGRRLDRLGGDARRVLTTAAIIGRSFSLRLLEELENQQPDAVLNAIEEAERAHLVVAEPAGRDARYRFVHELVRQTISETLSLPRRQRLHARVVEAIERVYSANLEAQASPLAHHLYQAGAAADSEKTTTYLVLAAKQARASAAHEEALAHLENALSLWEGEQSVRVAELTEQRAVALGRMGRRDESVEGYRKAIALFESAGAVTKAAATSLILARGQGVRVELAAAHRTIDRALDRLGSADPQLKMSLLTMRAVVMSNGGDATGAADLLAEVKAQRKTADGGPLKAFDEFMELYCLATSMRFEEMLATARRLSESHRAAGDLWSAAETERLVGFELFCGRTAEAAEHLPAAMLLANRVGHRGAGWVTNILWATLSIARGDLIAAEREMEEARDVGEGLQDWSCVFGSVELGLVAFLRGNLAEAERRFGERTEIEGQTFLAGLRDACLFAFRAESAPKGSAESRNAWKAWTDRSWKLPRIGQPNPWGAWLALERSVIGLAWLGNKEEAAALRPLTEELVLTGVWASLDLSPFRTAAGIAAACAGDWTAAEQHHLTAIHQTDAAPYRVSQPMAREWYATMLLDRNASEDAAKARGLLSEALAMYESVGMPFHASRAGGRMATL